jgi:A/G-specific adenine glycosylase
VLLRWGAENRRSFPWRETTDPWSILLAELLLQRSRSNTVAIVYRRIIDRWPDAHSLAGAKVEDLVEVIRPLGLTSRAARISALAAEISTTGFVPNHETTLRRLPGVGPYAAAVTAAAFGHKSQAIVDTVSERVFKRFFGARKATAPGKVAMRAYARTGRGQWHELNWAVLDLAASTCLPKKPQCHQCPLYTTCRAAARIKTPAA